MISKKIDASNERTFIKLIQDHSDLIHSLINNYYSNSADRQDCRQDIVLQLWKAYPSFQAKSKVSTWIYSVAIRTILNRKGFERKQLGSISLDLRPVTNISIGVDDHQLLVRQILNSLSDGDRAIMILYLEGYKYHEIGEIVDMSVTNVGTMLSRIKQRLKKRGVCTIFNGIFG